MFGFGFVLGWLCLFFGLWVFIVGVVGVNMWFVWCVYVVLFGVCSWWLLYIDDVLCDDVGGYVVG